MQALFNQIVETFNSLWHIRVLGESLEITTPMVTTTNKFVTVFITKRDEYYIVTDGGWICSGKYECEVDSTRRFYNKIFNYYLQVYNILVTQGRGNTFYYKREVNKNLVVNAVFELSNFISSVVSTSEVQFIVDKKEIRFNSQAKSYMHSVFGDRIKYEEQLIPYSSVKFSAVSRYNGATQVVNFISGSTASYYNSSLCKSNIHFDMLKDIENAIKLNHKISLLDDSNPSIINSPMVQEMCDYTQKKGNVVVLWSDKALLPEYLEAV